MKADDFGPNHPVVVAPQKSRFLRFPPNFILEESDGVDAGITYPKGFHAGGIVAGLKGSGLPDLGVVAVVDEYREQTSSAAVFTGNALAAPPVVVDREECDLAHLQAVVMNSGNANACTGEAGMQVARGMQEAVAATLGMSKANVGVASTGIIGVQLDPQHLAQAASEAARSIGAEGGHEFARSIMTTDRFPKTSAGSVMTSGGVVRLGVCAKGAGMISPAMATMLCVVTTDAELTPRQAGALLKQGVANSFNRVTVDGEMSTNDSVFLLASGASSIRPDDDTLVEIGAALDSMLLRMALMILADGEGATKIMRLFVAGADTDANAERVARAIGDSLLVKTAMHGCDPNWGRIASSTGAALANRSLPDIALELCGTLVMKGGVAFPLSSKQEAELASSMQSPEIDINLSLGLGQASAEIFFADIGHDYVTINADYHN